MRLPLKAQRLDLLTKILLGIFLYFGLTQRAAAVSIFEPKGTRFIQDPVKFKKSLDLPTTDHLEDVKIPSYKLRKRAFQSQKDPRIENLSLDLPKSSRKLDELSEKLARPGKEQYLRKALAEKMRTGPATDQEKVKVELDPGIFRLMSTQALGKEYAKPHHHVEVITAQAAQNPAVFNQLLAQLQPFLNAKERTQLEKKIASGAKLNLDKELLPYFARRMVKKFLVYKGPNCFHATLAFHGQDLTTSPFINIKEEKGYHAAMINYDELWRTLYSMFYEINPEVSPLKYGDILVFMNINPAESMNFRWIRHAAVYLFGDYTFSKGSKSPNSPYTVKTLAEEWKTWQGFTQKLGVKVFRRSAPEGTPKPPADLNDWIY